MFLKVIAVIFMVAGFGTVFASRVIVSKKELDKNIKVEFENEMNEEEIARYKLDKASVNVKMTGMLIALPGLVALFLALK